MRVVGVAAPTSLSVGVFTPPKDGILRGTAADADTNEPIAGVLIEAGASSVLTDNLGSFELSLPPSEYDVTVSAKGYLMEDKKVKIDPDETTELSISAIAVAEVWPGDTNNDGRISILDVLPIGRLWDKKGDERQPLKTEWEIRKYFR